MLNRRLEDYPGVIFDLDGTIVNLKVDWDALRQEIRRSFPKDDLVNIGLQQMISTLVQRYGEEARVALAGIIAAFEQPAGAVWFMPILKTLRAIQPLTSFYVISNNLHSTVSQAINSLDLGRKCVGIVGFEDVLHSKPSVEPFRKLTECHTIERPVAYIGDQQSDRDFARSALIDFIHVESL